MFTWILAQWEEYHTGIMLYGNSFYGVLEANYSISAIHILTYFVGPQLWREQVTTLVPALAGVTQLAGVSEWRWGCPRPRPARERALIQMGDRDFSPQGTGRPCGSSLRFEGAA